jgi:hypothetical protein
MDVTLEQGWRANKRNRLQQLFLTAELTPFPCIDRRRCFCYNILMVFGQTHTLLNSADAAWHGVAREHRVSVLGCTAFALLAVLYSLMGAGAQIADTGVQFEVTNSGFPINLIAIPEKRVPTTGNNGTLVTIEVRSIGSTTPLFSQTVNTGSGGSYSGLTLSLSPGTYDITAKGYSHLRVKKTSQSLAANTTIDFTAGGTSPLLSGDVNGTSGDNKVNGIDLTQIVSGLTAFNVRYDLNRDTRVNGIDLTNAVSNLNVTGAD